MVEETKQSENINVTVDTTELKNALSEINSLKEMFKELIEEKKKKVTEEQKEIKNELKGEIVREEPKLDSSWDLYKVKNSGQKITEFWMDVSKNPNLKNYKR